MVCRLEPVNVAACQLLTWAGRGAQAAAGSAGQDSMEQSSSTSEEVVRILLLCVGIAATFVVVGAARHTHNHAHTTIIIVHPKFETEGKKNCQLLLLFWALLS